MSIHFVTGRPGGGKSLYGMKLLVGELTRGTRPVVTNLAVKLGELNAYLQDKHPELWERMKHAGTDPGCVNVHPVLSRVRILSDEEIATFYLHRMNRAGDWYDVVAISKADEGRGVRPDYSVVTDDGVLFIIDEIHERFNARAWMDTGKSVLHYLSQHRKLGDDVIAITQAVGNVDKQFRSVAQDFTTITNLGKRKVSLFRMPAVFMRKVYPTPPDGAHVIALESSTFTLDVAGLAGCYDTARGVGLQGKLADTQRKPPGISWAWAVGAAMVVILLLIALPRMLAGSIARNMNKKGRMVKAAAVTNAPPFALPLSNQPQAVVEIKRAVEPRLGGDGAGEKVECCGWIAEAGGGGLEFLLSNGTKLYSRNGDVQKIGQGYILSRGLVIPMRKPDTGEKRERRAEAVTQPQIAHIETTPSQKPVKIDWSQWPK